jgi:hypothetical protein
MKNIIKLTESELVKIVEKIIKEDDMIKCPPKVKVSKQLIDSKLNIISKEVDDWINSSKVSKMLDEMDSKYKDIVKKILIDSKPIIIEINKKLAYANYGVIPHYNQTQDVTNLVNTFYKGIISEIEGNFITKNLMKVYITKSNIQSVKNSVSSILDNIFIIIRRITYDPFHYGIKSDINKTIKKCSDGTPSYIGGTYELADVKQLLVNQKNSINKLLDTYV